MRNQKINLESRPCLKNSHQSKRTFILLFIMSLFFIFPAKESLSDTKTKPSIQKKQKASLKKNNKKKKFAKKKKSKQNIVKVERKPANAKCSFTFTDIYSPGAATLLFTCKSEDKKLCAGLGFTAPNACEGSTLIKHYCNYKESESDIFFEEIECPNGCHDPKDGPGFCLRPEEPDTNH